MYLKESLKWNYVVGFAMMVGGVFVIFKKWWQGMGRRGFRLTVTFPEG